MRIQSERHMPFRVARTDPKKPTWQEVFAALDAAQFPDNFLDDRYAGTSPIPDQREDL